VIKIIIQGSLIIALISLYSIEKNYRQFFFFFTQRQILKLINGLTSCQQCHCKMKDYHVSPLSTVTLPAQTPSPEICGALEKPMPCSIFGCLGALARAVQVGLYGRLIWTSLSRERNSKHSSNHCNEH